MDSLFTVAYQIVDSFTGESFVVNEEYQARHYYEGGDHVTEVHTFVTLSPPFNKTETHVSKIWHDKDSDNNNRDPETEEEK